MSNVPFEVTVMNEMKPDKQVRLLSDDGRLIVKVKNLDIEIKQSDDELGVVIDVYPTESIGDPITGCQAWFEDAEEDAEN